MNGRNKFIIFSCSLLILIISACMTMTDEISTNQERAREIIQAINEYENDNDRLPEQLDVLVPKYLTKIPKTLSEQDFSYSLDELDGYNLIFDVVSRQNLGCRYIYRLENWDCSYGDPH